MAAFATAAELQTFIGGDSITTARANALLDHASAVIRRYTGQTLSEVAGDVVAFVETPFTRLFLPQRPVTAISSVVVNGVPLVQDTDYTVTRVGVLYRESGWPDGAIATYDHGYAAASDEMAAIKVLCLQMAARAYTMNKGTQFEQFAGQSEASGFAPELVLEPNEKAALADFGPVLVG